MLKYMKVAVGHRNTNQRMLRTPEENTGKDRQKTVFFHTRSSKINDFRNDHKGCRSHD